MNLYLISQSVNNDYDTYSAAVVAAESELAAQETHPCSYVKEQETANGKNWIERAREEPYYNSEWTLPENVTVKLIGTATPGTPAGVICASYHAG